MPELTQIRVHYTTLAANLLKSLMSAVRESHMPTPKVTSIWNQGHCLYIYICGTLIDLMCILRLKVHFSSIFPKKFD